MPEKEYKKVSENEYEEWHRHGNVDVSQLQDELDQIDQKLVDMEARRPKDADLISIGKKHHSFFSEQATLMQRKEELEQIIAAVQKVK